MSDLVKRLRDCAERHESKKLMPKEADAIADEIERIEDQIKTLHQIIEVRNAVVLDDLREWANSSGHSLVLAFLDAYEKDRLK